VLIRSVLIRSCYFPDELSGEDGDGGVGLIEPGVVELLLLPVLDSVPPGEVAPPVEDPAVIPKCE